MTTNFERRKELMKRGKKILALFLIITMLLPFVMNIPAEAAEKSKQLDVLFTHDTHSHLNSFSTIVDGEFLKENIQNLSLFLKI